MSGVFLTVWDFTKDPKGGSSVYDEILQTTKGGYPHLTLFHSGKHIPALDLKAFVSNDAFSYWVSDRIITITHAYLNSFQLGPQGVGPWRHDCLLAIDGTTAGEIDEYRASHVADQWPQLYAEGKLSMNSPHITAGIHWTREEAQTHVNAINKLLDEKGPRQIKIVGVTIYDDANERGAPKWQRLKMLYSNNPREAMREGVLPLDVGGNFT